MSTKSPHKFHVLKMNSVVSISWYQQIRSYFLEDISKHLLLIMYYINDFSLRKPYNCLQSAVGIIANTKNKQKFESTSSVCLSDRCLNNIC